MSQKLFIFLAGIALSAGLAYLWISIRQRKYRGDFFFGVFSMAAGIYYLMASNGGFDIHATLFFATMMFLSFPWYIAFASGYVNKRILLAITVLAFSFYVFLLAHSFLDTPKIHPIFSYMAYLLIGAYCIRCCVEIVRKEHKVRWPFLFVSGFFCLFAIEEVSFDLIGMALPWRGMISFTYLDLFPTIIISMKFVLLVYDQFEKKKLETAISLYRNNIDRILNQTKRFVLTLDLDGKVLFANPHFREYFRLQERIIDANFIESFSIEQENGRFCGILKDDAIGAGDIICPIRTPKGNRTVAWSFVKLKDDGSTSTFNYLYLFGADITAQIQAEEDLKKAYRDLEELKNKLLAENIQLRSVVNEPIGRGALIGESPIFKYVLSRIEDVAPNDIPVLLEGETGVGKELFANAIHQKSDRNGKPFVKVNCAAIPAQLLESELFGFERGAFTGADRLKRGMFELASGGTLFLDEIGDLPIILQPKLLRALQESEIQRLGSEKVTKVDVRLVVATNRSLEKEVEQGRFRSDLYYRINVFPITIPPLRQRRTDIPLLVKSFANTFNEKYDKNVQQVPGSLMGELMSYPWPGNVRQLRNVIERAVITSSERVLRLGDPLPAVPVNGEPVKDAIVDLITLDECERNHIIKVLDHCHWQVSGANGAAELLGLPSSTLRSRMNKLRIHR